MNEEFREVRSTVDWWSRLIALGSLAVSGAAFYYAYVQETTLPVSTQSTTDGRVAEVQPGQTTSVPAVTPPGNMLTPTMTPDQSQPAEPVADSSSSAPIDWMTEKARPVEPANQAQSPVVTPPSSADTVSEESDGTLNDLEKPIEPSFEEDPGAPMLATVRTMLKPTSDVEFANATVRNSGDGTARILELIFHPDAVEQIPKEAAVPPNWGATDDKQLIVRFSNQDNRTSTAGRHGDYIRELPAPYLIEPGGTVDLRMLLENPEHVGYSLVGKLTMRLAGGNEFQIDRVAIPFVDPSSVAAATP